MQSPGGQRGSSGYCVPPPLERFQGVSNLVDMARDLHLVPDLAHDAFLVDEERRTIDTHVLAAVEALLDPRPVLLADLAVLIGDEREGQLILGLELVVARDRVLAHAD